MSQSDGEPAWQGKTYNALKDKKHLTGINKEEVNPHLTLANKFYKLKQLGNRRFMRGPELLP